MCSSAWPRATVSLVLAFAGYLVDLDRSRQAGLARPVDADTRVGGVAEESGAEGGWPLSAKGPPRRHRYFLISSSSGLKIASYLYAGIS